MMIMVVMVIMSLILMVIIAIMKDENNCNDDNLYDKEPGLLRFCILMMIRIKIPVRVIFGL